MFDIAISMHRKKKDGKSPLRNRKFLLNLLSFSRPCKIFLQGQKSSFNLFSNRVSPLRARFNNTEVLHGREANSLLPTIMGTLHTWAAAT